MPKLLPRFAKQLKALRTQKSMTQEQFAGLVGVNLRTLQGWEAGRSQPEYAEIMLEAITRRAQPTRDEGSGARSKRKEGGA